MKFRQLVDKLISEPGQFLVFESNVAASSSKQQANKNYLNMFTNPEAAKKVFVVYEMSHNNAASLLKEATVLSDKGFFARAVA